MIRRDSGSRSEPHLNWDRKPDPGEMLSVVVPLFDEEANVPVLVDRLLAAVDALKVSAEVILVDDGSRDGTVAAIARANRRDARVIGLTLSRNFGHQAAISAGLEEARGTVVVVMDGDLQDPPEAIGPLWERLKEGYDVVYAIRASRPEGPLKRWAYFAHYRLLRALGTVVIPVDAGDFGIMSRAVVDAILAMPERNRYLRGLRAWVGFHQCGLEIDRGARLSGRPKFTLGKLAGLAIDGFIGFSDLPLRLIGVVGALVLLITMTAAGATLFSAFSTGGSPPGWVLIALLIGFSTGVQSIGMAILGMYLARALSEARGRPLFVVRKRIGADSSPSRRAAPSQTRKRPNSFR